MSHPKKYINFASRFPCKIACMHVPHRENTARCFWKHAANLEETFQGAACATKIFLFHAKHIFPPRQCARTGNIDRKLVMFPQQ